MDQDIAKALFDNGATFVLLDIPLNSEFGIDYNSWRIGPNFRGVKMIPPGIHFIYYSVSDRHGNVGIRNGFFYNFKIKEIVLRKWNKQDEVIEGREPTDDEIERICENKMDLDRFLAPYPYDEYKKWIALSNYLNETMMNKLLPLNGIITSETTLVGQKFSKSRSEKKGEKSLDEMFPVPTSLEQAESQLPVMSENEEAKIRFSKIFQHKFPFGASATQISQHSIDMSFNLEQMLASVYDGKYENLFCEIQFAFICFLIGYVYDAFEQWKLLVNLLCNSEKIIKLMPDMYFSLIQILYFQIKEIPEDFFVDVITKNNFLIICLHNLFDNIENLMVDEGNESLSRLKEKSKQFRVYLKELFDFDFDMEPDEYAPTICE
jgi:A1 cistron-splicing factor AAR2